MAPPGPERKANYPLAQGRVDERAAMDATGICSSNSSHWRFQERGDAGVFERFWQDGLLACLHVFAMCQE